MAAVNSYLKTSFNPQQFNWLKNEWNGSKQCLINEVVRNSLADQSSLEGELQLLVRIYTNLTGIYNGIIAQKDLLDVNVGSADRRFFSILSDVSFAAGFGVLQLPSSEHEMSESSKLVGSYQESEWTVSNPLKLVVATTLFVTSRFLAERERLTSRAEQRERQLYLMELMNVVNEKGILDATSRMISKGLDLMEKSRGLSSKEEQAQVSFEWKELNTMMHRTILYESYNQHRLNIPEQDRLSVDSQHQHSPVDGDVEADLLALLRITIPPEDRTLKEGDRELLEERFRVAADYVHDLPSLPLSLSEAAIQEEGENSDHTTLSDVD